MGNTAILEFDLAYAFHCPNTFEMQFQLTNVQTDLSSMLTAVFDEDHSEIEDVKFSDQFKETLAESYQGDDLVESIQKALSAGIAQFLDYNPFEKSYFTVLVEVSKKGVARHTSVQSAFVRYQMETGASLEFSHHIKGAVAQAIRRFNKKNAQHENMLKPIELQIRRLLDRSNDQTLYNAVLSDTFAIHPMDDRPQDEFSFCTMSIITDITNSTEINHLADVMARLPHNSNDLIYTESTECLHKSSLIDQHADA